jgi:hypothetical protein
MGIPKMKEIKVTKTNILCYDEELSLVFAVTKTSFNEIIALFFLCLRLIRIGSFFRR